MPYKTPGDEEWRFTILEKLKIKIAKTVMGPKLWKFLWQKSRTVKR